MSKGTWTEVRDRLMMAAMEARNWLCGILPELDRAIAAGADQDGLLTRLQALAVSRGKALSRVEAA